MTHQIYRRPMVTAITGLPTSSLYRKISRGEFPAPIFLGARSVGWLAGEVHAWIEKQSKQPRSLRQAQEQRQ